MSTATYTPRPGSVADQVVTWLAANPDEELSAADVAAKFDATRNNVHTLLSQAVKTGLLIRTENLADGELVYRIGSGQTPAPTPAPAAKFGAHRPFPAPAQRAPLALDIAAIRIDDGVPMPTRQGTARTQQAELRSLMSDMAVGQSFAVTARARHAIQRAATDLKKADAGLWCVRKVADADIRCWRVS